jgi:tetratricopeptide (TPR) repeat protein
VPVIFSDYAFIPPDDIRLYQFLSSIQDREIAFLYRIFSNSELAVLEALSTDMKAIRNAEVAEGTFPLLIYHSDFNRGVAENAVMCEYLASHGFVVAVTHSFGLAAIRSEPDPAALETMVGDIEFVIGALHDLDFIDHDKLGIFGYRGGAMAALLLQMRSYNVDAVAVLENAFRDSLQAEWATGNPYYDIARMSVPLLEVYSSPQEGQDQQSVTPFKYAPRYSLGIRDTRGLDFTTYGLLPAAFLPSDPAGPRPNTGTYEVVCSYVMNFFDGHLNGTEASLAFLACTPSENGLEPERAVLARMEARERPPTEDEFLAILAGGDVETAVGLYDKFTAAEPDLILFPEAVMNVTGYRYLQRGLTGEAIAIFKMNAETYPQSANCWDSLAEAYIANGDNDHALECVQRVLEVLPNETDISDDLRQALESNAERYMEMLKEE